jgi:exonuclease VII large subunit
MVYAEVYNIMMSPKDYIGKNIKMSGECVITPNEDFSKNYYACLIKDATACCSQGLEFELEDENSYPEEGETVTVSGVFETYEENGTLFCHLENAKLYN